MRSRAAVVSGWALSIGVAVVLAFVGLLHVLGAFLYLTPASACDSTCWTNSNWARFIGAIDVAVGCAAIGAVPVAMLYGRRRKLRSAIAITGVVLLLVGTWTYSNHLLDLA